MDNVLIVVGAMTMGRFIEADINGNKQEKD